MTGTETPSRGALDRLRGVRARVRRTRSGRLAWRVVITLLGVAVIVLGIVLLPLPGPGWLIIFGGLGLLATEYEWASRLLQFARSRVSAWTNWVTTQSRLVQALVGLAGLALLAGLIAVGWWFYRR